MSKMCSTHLLKKWMKNNYVKQIACQSQNPSNTLNPCSLHVV